MLWRHLIARGYDFDIAGEDGGIFVVTTYRVRPDGSIAERAFRAWTFAEATYRAQAGGPPGTPFFPRWPDSMQGHAMAKFKRRYLI